MLLSLVASEVTAFVPYFVFVRRTRIRRFHLHGDIIEIGFGVRIEDVTILQVSAILDKGVIHGVAVVEVVVDIITKIFVKGVGNGTPRVDFLIISWFSNSA